MITIDYMVDGYYRISKDGARIADVENRNSAVLIKIYIERLEARIAELESALDECHQSYDDC